MIQAHYVNVLDCQNLETIPFTLEDVCGMTDLAKSNPIFPFLFEFQFHSIILLSCEIKNINRWH